MQMDYEEYRELKESSKTKLEHHFKENPEPEPLRYHYAGHIDYTRFKGEDTDYHYLIYVENPEQLTEDKWETLSQFFFRHYSEYCRMGYSDLILADESIKGEFHV